MIDLDPGEGLPWEAVVETASRRKLLEAEELDMAEADRWQGHPRHGAAAKANAS